MGLRQRLNDALILKHRATLHMLRIDDYFYRNSASDMAMEQIVFGYGTVWRYR